MVIKSFIECGISVQPDGTQDHLISVRELPEIGGEVMDQEEEWKRGGIVCNLMPPGDRPKRWAGKGLLPGEEDWAGVLGILDENNALADEAEVEEEEQEEAEFIY